MWLYQLFFSQKKKNIEKNLTQWRNGKVCETISNVEFQLNFAIMCLGFFSSIFDISIGINAHIISVCDSFLVYFVKKKPITLRVSVLPMKPWSIV